MSDEKWLQSTYTKVVAYDVTKIPLTRIEVDGRPVKLQDGHDYFCMFPKRNGMIRFMDGSWVCITSHSVHEEDGIGDLTLALTSKGEYYVNRGHCCMNLSLVSNKKEVATLDDFLSTKGTGDNETLFAWERYKGEAGAGQPATKPADNVPGKDQPSTPTSKDSPR